MPGRADGREGIENPRRSFRRRFVVSPDVGEINAREPGRSSNVSPAEQSAHASPGQPKRHRGRNSRSIATFRLDGRTGTARVGLRFERPLALGDRRIYRRNHGTGNASTPVLGLLARDFPGKKRERGCLKKAEADPVVGKFREPPTVVEPPARDRAHVVV
jgi:hypothetical protein